MLYLPLRLAEGGVQAVDDRLSRGLQSLHRPATSVPMMSSGLP